MVSNPVSGELVEVTFDELTGLFASSAITQALDRWRESPLVEGIVVFECLDLSSPTLGHRSGVYWGPTETYRSLEALAAGTLGELPSEQLFPRYFWRKTDEKAQ